MDNHIAGAALVAWLLLAPIVGAFVSAGWGGRHTRARGDELRR